MIHLLAHIKFWVDFAQIVTTLVAVIGVILSFWIARRTLREVQKDRIISQRPFLLFEYGGYGIRMDYIKHDDDKVYNQAYWPVINDKGGIKIETVGQLKNYGTGPALDIRIQWIVEEVYIKNEKFVIDELKRKERKYAPEFNINPIMTSHLYPNQESGFHLIPYFISTDFEKKIERASGYLIISYSDTYQNKHETHQKFNVFTDYEKKWFHTTFSDLIN